MQARIRPSYLAREMECAAPAGIERGEKKL